MPKPSRHTCWHWAHEGAASAIKCYNEAMSSICPPSASWFVPSVTLGAALATLIAGCGGSSAGVTYSLAITPVVPTNQSPFDGVENVRLSVIGADGTADAYDLGAPDSGLTLSELGIGVLDNASLLFEGQIGDVTVSRGRTPPLSASTGSQDSTVLFGSVDQVGWIGGLANAVVGPTLIPVGNGTFHVFGGVGVNSADDWKKTSEIVQKIVIGSPSADFVYETIGAAPTWTDMEDDEHIGFFGSSIAMIATGADAGKVFVGGGGISPGLIDPKPVTSKVWLYNPEDSTFEALSNREGLASPRSEAATVVDAQGAVVMWGGWTHNSSERSVAVSTTVEVWDPETRRAETLEDYNIGATPMFDGAGASLGSKGSLFCGGSLQDSLAETDGNNYASWYTDSACHRISLGHDVTADTEMPVPLAGLAMVGLLDGRVFASGGATQSTEVFVDFVTGAPALADGWFYDPDTRVWSPAGSMNVARVGHKMSLLPDGRVLIVGGVTDYVPGSVLATGLSCVEIFDPNDSSYTPLADCDADSDTDGLAGRAGLPGIAIDPNFGVIIAGGLVEEKSAQNAVNVVLWGD